MELAVFAHGDEEGHVGSQAVPDRAEGGVAHAVAAFVAVQGGFGGEESGVPCFFAGFLNIIEAAAVIPGDCVVAVAEDPLQLGIPIEAVSAGGIGNHAEEILAAQIIDPGKRGGGGGDYIFPPGIIKISVFHDRHSFALHTQCCDTITIKYKSNPKFTSLA